MKMNMLKANIQSALDIAIFFDDEEMIEIYSEGLKELEKMLDK